MSKAGKHVPAARAHWMTDELLAKLAAAARDGRITCAAAQQFARENAVSPEDMKGLLDVAGLKVQQCRLGCF